MYAIFVVGGKQYRAQEGDVLFVEKLEGAEGEEVVFDKVLLAGDKVGQPYLEGAKVTAKVVKQGLSKKIRIYKYKAKHNSARRTIGHRQPYTCLVIESIA